MNLHDRKGFVYFALADFADAVKIGFSAYPRSRVEALDRSSAIPVRLICAARGGSDLETALHVRFAHWRERYEWFRYSPEIKTYVEELLASGAGCVPPARTRQRRFTPTRRHNRVVPRFGIEA